ncbi:MAG: endonuclease/exonuclease/phosphatase family protein [Actinomycetota bacterium]|nr:endonuclease/exonuclease/phosphatase family protein [Actinomycetota bacterium]
MSVLRVLSYNMRSLRDDRAALVRVVRDAAPDVVCVQEAPKWFRWRSRCADLARRCDLFYVTGGLPAGNNILMAKVEVEVESTADYLFTRRFGLHQRGMAMAVCSLGGARFRVVSTHLDMTASDRRLHVDEIFAALSPLTDPVILGADVNEHPGQPAWEALAAVLPESGAGTRGRRIDGIFASPALTLQCAEVVDSPDARIASDHLPLLAEFELAL